MIGQTISHYKITSKLGEGGMGEVYRAEDTTLKREVAIKVLPEQFTQDAERLARFRREAQVLASLNHPNVAAIHGLEEADGVRFLVLELVEGETLGERLSKGPLGVEEALEICRQIAEGLEAAHESGIIHRDLKPANVKVTPEAKVKLLDFGLAKALEDEIPAADLTHSPTRTDQMTNVGMIMGTAGYMSPEQARGQVVDKRTDIWAFGSVLYELLTGSQVFFGDTVTDILGAVLHKDPDWKALPEGTPRAIRRLLRRCLERDPHERLRDIGDARIVIGHVLSEPVEDSGVGVATATPVWWQEPTRLAVVGLMVLVAGVLLGFPLWNLVYNTQPPPPTVARFSIVLPEDEAIPGQPSLALSPDGTQLVYAAVRDNTMRLYLRATDQLEAKPIPGTEHGWSPFFSPDGKWVGFFTLHTQVKGELKKWSLLGGEPVTICEGLVEGLVGRGASWGEDDTIIFGRRPGLWRVSSNGGIPEPLIPEGGPSFPQIFPGAKAVLFRDRSGVRVLSLDTGQQSTLMEGAHKGRYLPSGHLVYQQGNSLLAAPFDLDALELQGTGVPVVDDVWFAPGAKFEVSSSGSLAYVPGSQVDRADALVWVDRQGKEEPFLETQMQLYNPRLSPDGKRLAIVTRKGNEGRYIRTCEIERCVLSPLTSKGGNAPVWSPDASRIFFTVREKGANMGWISADGSGEPEGVLEREYFQFPTSLSSNGKVLVFEDWGERGDRDILTLRLDGNAKPEPFHVTQFDERDPVFSPDGNWIVFTSNRSGRDEIYVKRYPAEGGLLSISTDGGHRPFWAPHSGEIFYREGDKMMTASVETQPNVRVGKPRTLFVGLSRLGREPAPVDRRDYDPTPDGQRFLIVKRGEESVPTQINVVLNWAEELKRLVPTEK